MGPGHDRPGRDADQPLRQHAARDEPGNGRRVVADVRVPPDVPADRPVRRVDRDRGAAGGLAPCGGRRHARDSATRCRAGSAMMLMLNVPATVGLIVLATPIVRLLFERGQFLPADTAATAAALRFYAIGLVGYSAVRIASPTFYALGDSRVPVDGQRRRDRRQRRR